MTPEPSDTVARRRYEREQAARAEAERLLEQKSRELYVANERLKEQSETLEQTVRERTAELELALEQAKAASLARSRFVATMSHEIRTPLGGVLGMIDLLAMDEEDPKKIELLSYASTAGVGLRRIVNDVLDFSKMEAGVFVFQEESVDIRALVESITMLAPHAQQSENRSILSKIAQNVPQRFLGDATRIRQVVSNLVSNALRYSTEGPVIIRATASEHSKGALLRIEVEDFGVGIADDKLPHLFKDFSQIHNPLTAAAQGTGLGLAICKRIMMGLGGKIGVESTTGIGSTFWVELAVTVLDAKATSPGSESQGTEDRPLTLDGKRVLIAEDNVINQKLLLTYAKRMNLQAELAENGRIAVEKFEPGKFDLILMDVAMPEMDGLQATQTIRTKWAEHDIPPIVALTAHVMDAIEDEARAVGIDHILCKPIPFEELKTALENLLGNAATAAPQTQPTVTSPPPENPPAPIISRMDAKVVQEMQEFFSPDDLVKFADKYVQDARTRITLLIAAEQVGRRADVISEAHSLKGSSLVMGFSEIAEIAKAIELGGHDQDSDTVTTLAQSVVSALDTLDALT